MINIVNIKDANPNVGYAMYLLEQAISDTKKLGFKVLVVIHGYGSHGIGGDIKKSAMQLLKKFKKEGTIRTFVKGEEWGDTNKDKQLINAECPETIVNSQIGNLNSGVTVVLVG